MSKQWPSATEGRIPTKNQYGFMFLDKNGATPAFIEYAKHATGTLLDLGCAYGIATLPALQDSHASIIAFDLSQEHLDILTASATPEEQKRLTTTVQGRFPNDFHFQDASFDAIHSSYMFHFLDGTDTERGLGACLRALKPGGKLYLNTLSVFFKPFSGVLSLYEKNTQLGATWPGEIFNFKSHAPAQDECYIPDFLHVHTLENLRQIVEQAGFIIETAFYYDLKEPEWTYSDGKSCIGLIAKKP